MRYLFARTIPIEQVGKGNNMLLKTYKKRIFRPECNPSFQSLHCIAHLNEDVGEALPYLNSVLGGLTFYQSPPAVTFKVHGKLITVQPREIAVNALTDEEEADKILEWLKREINDVWERREEIQPKYDGIQKPNLLEVLKLLPKTNCRECGQPTCIVFSTLVIEGAKGPDDCPQLPNTDKSKLIEYLSKFYLDI